MKTLSLFAGVAGFALGVVVTKAMFKKRVTSGIQNAFTQYLPTVPQSFVDTATQEVIKNTGL